MCACADRTCGTHLPVMEDGQAEGLALCVRAQIRFEAERIDGGKEGFDDVERRAGDWRVLRHVTASSRQYGVDGRHAVSRRLHLHEVVRLHQPRRRLWHMST